MSLEKTQRAKMIFLIKRREGVSRDELIVHWFKNHMPAVIDSQVRAHGRGRDGASKYIAQLFTRSNKDQMSWDGLAQLWFKEPQKPAPISPDFRPSDTFQEKAAPYFSWATREYVVMDGSDGLSTEPLMLNEAYPMTRSGFHRVNYLVPAKDGTDFEELYAHWLGVHVPNVKSCMEQSGGFRYVVSHSIFPSAAPYAGMAELYFPDNESWKTYRSLIKADGMEKYVDSARMDIMYGDTEMVGIP